MLGRASQRDYWQQYLNAIADDEKENHQGQPIGNGGLGTVQYISFEKFMLDADNPLRPDLPPALR
jgi:hypothetical protein